MTRRNDDRSCGDGCSVRGDGGKHGSVSGSGDGGVGGAGVANVPQDRRPVLHKTTRTLYGIFVFMRNRNPNRFALYGIFVFMRNRNPNSFA